MTAAWDEARRTWDQVAATVDQHRDWMLPSLRPHRLWVRRANVPAVVTGLPGTGKTVLRDGLLGQSGGLDYRTEQSHDWERDRVMFRGKGVAARVGCPTRQQRAEGQQGLPAYQANEDAALRKRQWLSCRLGR